MPEKLQLTPREHLEAILLKGKRNSPLIKALMDRIHLENTDIPEENLGYYNNTMKRVRRRRASKFGKEYAEGLRQSHTVFAPYFEGWQQEQGKHDPTYLKRLRAEILVDLHDINERKKGEHE
jgi:hypothetical protein